MRTFEAITSEIPAWEQAQAKARRAEQLRVIRGNVRRVNDVLHAMGLCNHANVPLDTVNDALTTYGFDSLEPMILCGREGRIHEYVGRDKWLALSWYKMESGRYEVVAYVS